jgi:hypothetical protein
MGMKPPLHAQFPDGKYAAGTAAPLETRRKHAKFQFVRNHRIVKNGSN